MKEDTAEPRGRIRAFLIADVRGYTLFTQERGDEAAAKLASRFAGVVREAVERRGGTLIELRGDEALVVFDSPRQAIRAAVELQERFVEETLADPSLPLTVGIGLDAGEAVPIEGGYRGGALNLAARLCGQARAGECLATQEVVHLARTVEGVRYEDRGALSLKGLAQPIRVVRPLPVQGDPAERLAPLVSARPPAPHGLARLRTWVRDHRVAATLVAGAVGAAVTIPVVITSGGGGPEIDRDAVGILDLDSGEVVEAIELPGRPGAAASGAGGVWIAQPDQGTVSRIDPRTRAVVDTIQVGSDPEGVVVGAGSVWVANAGTATISRISPETNTVVQTVEAPSGPAGIASGAGSVWVAGTIDDTVSRYDAAEGTLEETIAVGDRPAGVAVGQHEVWVANAGSGTVSRIDVETNTEATTVDVGNGPAAVAIGLGSVWVSNSLDGTVSRINPATNAVTGTIRVGEEPGKISIAGGAVWVANELDGTLSRVDPDSGSVETILLGSEVAGATGADGSLWVGVRAAEAAHRGGTLTVVQATAPDYFDPALAYSPDGWSLLTMTNDGLVGLKRAGGLEGTTLVPNLATSLPTPTDGGTTYTFQLRRGIRYSTGEPVRPQDFRRAIERAFTVGIDAQGFYRGIVGAEACGEKGCDLSTGIATDSSAVTFHLKSPDPEFLYKLALPFAFAVPQDTPDEELREPVAATGPYRITAHSHSEIRLERNSRFEEWSAAAHPDGFPDQIVWRFEVGLDEAVDEVLGGEADLMFDSPDVGRLDELRARYPGQIHAFPAAATWFLGLDLSLEPFDDVRVRRAVNYAVDRARLTDLTGGLGTPTCQILPPNFPGYEPYCPYTQHQSEEGLWDGPDLVEAHRLVEASGTVGTPVTVWVNPIFLNGAGAEVGSYVVDVLDELGYRARLKAVNDVGRYFEGIFDPRTQVQVFIWPWAADYPEASGFISPQFQCDAPANFSGFCDPELDQKMEETRILQVTDRSKARAAWVEIERDIVDQAPVVALINSPTVQLVSDRVGNYQAHPEWWVLVDQLWVR